MKTACPHCSQHYEIDDSSVGMEATCEKCGKNFFISVSVEPVGEVLPVSKKSESPILQNCPFCGGELRPGVKKCRHCGEWLNPSDKPKSPVIYVLLAFFFGMLGIHNFYSGAKAKGWIKLLLLFGAVPVALLIGVVILLPLFLLFGRVSPSASTPGMSLGAVESLLFSLFAWLSSAVWCIVEMFHCREEIAAGNIPLRPKMKQWLKWISVSIPVSLMIFTIIVSIASCSSNTSSRVALYKEGESSSLTTVPTLEDNRKATETLSRLDELARMRKRRPLTTQEKIEASKLFDYMIRVHTVKFNDPDGRRLLKGKKSEWDLE